MALIEASSKAYIAQRAQQNLVKRTLGGVTQESAISAIEQATSEAITEGNKRIGSLELQVRDNESRIAELKENLNNEKSAHAEQTNELQEKLNSVNKQLAAANAIKIGKPKILPNGNIETIRVNRNGFRETTETLADGRKVSKKFENIDGDILKITYNPSTGKPLKSFSNINGDTLTEYSENEVITKAVNNKKVAPAKPTIIKTELVKDESNRSNGISEIRRSYSDGSYDYIKYSHYQNSPIKETKVDKNGRVMQETEYRFYDRYKTAKTTIYDTERNQPSLIIEKSIYKNNYKPEGVYKLETRRYVDEKHRVNKKITKFSNGLTQIIGENKDEYGFCNHDNPSLKYIYPKTSKIKSSEIIYYTQFHAKEEILKMKDGSTIKLKINENYDAYEALITGKDGKEFLDDRIEIRKYLKDIGKNAGISSQDYYYNCL